MCSKITSGNFSDESQQSILDTDEVSRTSFDSSVQPDVNSNSDRDSSVTSPSSSLSPAVSVCDHQINSNKIDLNKQSYFSEDLREEKVVESRKQALKVNYDSISSLSVSSSPEKQLGCGEENIKSTGGKESCATIRPSIRVVHCSSSPDQSQVSSFQHLQPVALDSPLIMPFTLFQNSIMSKMGNLASSRDLNPGAEHYHRSNINNTGFHFDLNANNPNCIDNNCSSHKRFGTYHLGGKSCEKKLKHEETSSTTKRLSFGIDRILSDENSVPESNNDGDDEDVRVTSPVTQQRPTSVQDHITKLSTCGDPQINLRHPTTLHHHNHNNPQQYFSHHQHPSSSPINLGRCGADCYILSRYGRNNSTLQYPSLLINSSSSVVGTGGSGNSITASFSPWMSNASLYENSPLLSPTAYHQQSTLQTNYGLGPSNYSTMSSLVACNAGSGGRRKRSWSRAVFSSLQRKGLEKRFQIQKYITKPDRRQLAATLGLTDAQVKVWFQNRRMKWRHSKEGKVTSGIGESISIPTPSSSTVSNSSAIVSTTVADKK